MRKFLLSFALLVAGAMTVGAQTPFKSFSGLESETYPYELKAEDAADIAAKQNLTIVVEFQAPSDLSGRKALVCGADPTKAAVTNATKDDSPYFAFGMNKNAYTGIGYLASSRAGDRFTAAEGIQENKKYIVTYVIDATNGNVVTYINGQQKNNVFTNGAAGGYQLQTFYKLFNNAAYKSNAKIYIGGGKVNTGNYDTFNGQIYSVDFYDSALSDDDVKAVYEAKATEAITYTLTDEAGTTYEGEFTGLVGTSEPSLSGVVGYDLTNKIWVDNHFTATITFPFPVSSATTTNATMISSFGNSSYKWYADGTNISTKEDIEPALTNLSAYQWAIYPKCVNGAFSFTIKNIATGKYIYSTSNANSHAEGTVTFAVEGSELTFENNRFKLSTGKYLSLNSTNVNKGDLQYVGTWGGHNGCNLAFPTTVYTVKISDAMAATLTTPIAVSLPPTGVTAGYVSDVNTDTKVLTYTDVTTIPAGESVVLFGEEGTYTFSATNDAEEFENENYLVGYTVATDISEGQTVYALGNKSNGVAFYKFGGTQYAAYKAYLQLPEADAQAIGYFNVFGGEGTTGIENTEVATQNSVVIFDLMGRRVETMIEGNIYIVNGRKVVR